MNVTPFLDLRQINNDSREEIEAALARVVRSGRYIAGPELERFEEDWARYCGAKYCVGVGNGLDALRLALQALDVGPGDEVIIPSNTFIATWLAVTQCGAKIVPVEPDPETYNLNPGRIEQVITSATKVIIPVHLYGQPADMASICAIAKRHGIRVLDDCAQAHGAEWDGKRVGGVADVSAWSFYPGKNLGALGDAGAITTSDAQMADRIRMLGNYGSRRKYQHELLGTNSRLDEMQAAVLTVKLAHLSEATNERRAVANRYLNALRGTEVKLPKIHPKASPVWHLFVVRHADRDALRSRLDELGIETLIHYPVAPHLQPAYRELKMHEGSLPISESIHREVLSLPIWPGMSEEQVNHVIEGVRRCA